MTDKELIKDIREQEEGFREMGYSEKTCEWYKLVGDRLEALLAENERLKSQMPKWRPASEPPKTSKTVFARDMAEQKPKTNADEIRAMDDEELGDLLRGLCKNAESCDFCPLHDSCPGSAFNSNRW